MSKNFIESEFKCKHCGDLKLSSELIAVLELIRLRFRKPVTITSGYRCPVHNKAIGGSPNSKHLSGIAADIKVNGVAPYRVFDFIDDIFPDSYGVGLYNSWVHIDVRSNRGRW